jgi:hypothetical protein
MILAAVALGGCSGRGEGEGEAAIAVAGTGIPVGAPGATGVSFEAPSAHPETSLPRQKPRTGPRPAPTLAPPDPFDPLDESPHGPDAGHPPSGPHPKKKKKGGEIHL